MLLGRGELLAKKSPGALLNTVIPSVWVIAGRRGGNILGVPFFVWSGVQRKSSDFDTGVVSCNGFELDSFVL